MQESHQGSDGAFGNALDSQRNFLRTGARPSRFMRLVSSARVRIVGLGLGTGEADELVGADVAVLWDLAFLDHLKGPSMHQPCRAAASPVVSPSSVLVASKMIS